MVGHVVEYSKEEDPRDTVKDTIKSRTTKTKRVVRNNDVRRNGCTRLPQLSSTGSLRSPSFHTWNDRRFTLRCPTNSYHLHHHRLHPHHQLVEKGEVSSGEGTQYTYSCRGWANGFTRCWGRCSEHSSSSTDKVVGFFVPHVLHPQVPVLVALTHSERILHSSNDSVGSSWYH